MMLHRHFAAEKPETITTAEDVSEKPEEVVSEIFPPVEAEKPKRGRPPKKAEE